MWNYIVSTISTGINKITEKVNGTCPVTTLPPLTECPTTNQTALNDCETACVNAVQTPLEVPDCMENCFNCCSNISTAAWRQIKEWVSSYSYVDCGQQPTTPPPTTTSPPTTTFPPTTTSPPMPPDSGTVGASDNTTTVASLMTVAVTSHLVGFILLGQCLQDDAPSKSILHGYRICQLTATTFTTAVAGVLGGSSAAGITFGVHVGYWLGAEALIARKDRWRISNYRAPLFDNRDRGLIGSCTQFVQRFC